MTLWQKLTAGPRYVRPCASCGKQVSISRVWILAILAPVTAGAFVANAVASLLLGSAAILAGGIAAVSIYIYAVPIVGRDV